MTRRILILCAVPLALIGGVELFSYFWMNPPKPAASSAYPVFPPPAADAKFHPAPAAYDDVKDQLFCSSGWMGTLRDDQAPEIRLAWFEWDKTSTGSTLEAFKHMPEACMGSAGMELQQIYQPRVFGEGKERLLFDTTRFRPTRGGAPVFVFKSVWVSGWEGADLRSDVLDGTSFGNLRSLRFAAVKNRFKPERTRVLMATVLGFPTEDLAWRWFKEESLGKLRWVKSAPNPGV